MAAARTLAVSVVSHLDLQARQTSIPVELAVIPVSLTIAATHRSLVGLAALEREGEMREGVFFLVQKNRLFVSAEPTLTSMHRQLGSPFSLTAHSLPAPQNTLAHTLLLLCSSWKDRNAPLDVYYRSHTLGGAVPPFTGPFEGAACVD